MSPSFTVASRCRNNNLAATRTGRRGQVCSMQSSGWVFSHSAGRFSAVFGSRFYGHPCPKSLTQPSVAVSPYVTEAPWKIQPASAMHRTNLPPTPLRLWLNCYIAELYIDFADAFLNFSYEFLKQVSLKL